jgi:hypothetical protein
LVKQWRLSQLNKWIRQYFKDKKGDGITGDSELTGTKIIDDLTKSRPVKPDQALHPHEFLFLVAHSEDRAAKLKEFPG